MTVRVVGTTVRVVRTTVRLSERQSGCQSEYVLVSQASITGGCSSTPLTDVSL
jgi:hypothetical protein